MGAIGTHGRPLDDHGTRHAVPDAGGRGGAHQEAVPTRVQAREIVDVFHTLIRRKQAAALTAGLRRRPPDSWHRSEPPVGAEAYSHVVPFQGVAEADAQSRSWIDAGCASSTTPRPSVSTSACRWRPWILLLASSPRGAAALRDLDAHGCRSPQRSDWSRARHVRGHA